MAKKYAPEEEKKDDFFDQLTFTDTEIREFEEWMKQFIVEKELHWPIKEKVKMYDLAAAMTTFGATNKHGAIIITVTEHDANGHIKSYARPSKYEVFNAKWEGMKKKIGKREYAQQKEREELDALAQSKTVHYGGEE